MPDSAPTLQVECHCPNGSGRSTCYEDDSVVASRSCR